MLYFNLNGVRTTYNKLAIIGLHVQQSVEGTQQQQQTMKASSTAITTRNIQIYIESFQKSLKDVHSSVTASPTSFPLSEYINFEMTT